jgi:hypothetical protein
MQRINKMFRRGLGCFFGISALLFSAHTEADQNFIPINKIERPSSYFLMTRCAGLMTAVSYWMGADAKDKALQVNVMKDAKFFTALAIRDGLDSGVPIERLRSQAVQQVEINRNMYLSRFKVNYAASAQGYGDDSEVQSDFSICQSTKKYILSE